DQRRWPLQLYKHFGCPPTCLPLLHAVFLQPSAGRGCRDRHSRQLLPKGFSEVSAGEVHRPCGVAWNQVPREEVGPAVLQSLCALYRGHAAG
ncbi:unnamed protein product, partial [Symbiodinium sp. KB8]